MHHAASRLDDGKHNYTVHLATAYLLLQLTLKQKKQLLLLDSIIPGNSSSNKLT